MLRSFAELIVLVVGLALIARWFEPRLAFFPSTGETVTPRELGVQYEALSIVTADRERLHGWRLRADAPVARVVYFHGNGGNLSVWAPILAGIARRGYEVLAFDYRGYGTSTGRPTERGLYRDVKAIVERLAPADPPGPHDRRNLSTPTVYWGRSLGTAMAAYAATIRPPDGVILESGFPDVRSLLRSSPVLAFFSLFSSYRFPSAEFLQHVHVPVLVLHGDADTVIPFAQGRKLFDRIEEPKQFITIRAGDHNDVTPRDADAYWRSIDRFVAGLSKPTDR